MLITTQRWKENITRDDRICLGYITLGNTVIDRELFSYKIKDTIYDDDFTGSFVKKKCDIQVLNKQREFTFDNQRISVYAGLKYDDNTTEYLFLGTYIVTTAKYDDVNYLSTLECYDLSTLLDIPYVSNPTMFPCTFRQYIEYCCTQCGIILSQNSFNLDSQTLVVEPYLDSGSTYRDAIRQICKVCLSNAQIIQDELVITGIQKNTIDFELTDFFELTSEAPIGPYNVLTLSRIPQEDNYVYPMPLPENPIEYRVENNPIVDKERDVWVENMYPYINGVTFIPNTIQLLKGRPEITAMDRYRYYDMEENQKITFVFTHEFEYNGVFTSKISCISKTQTQTNYKRAGTLEKRVATTELWVDKANGEIASLIQDMYESDGLVNTKISQVTQTVDELNSKISDIADITITGETSYATFTLNGINQSEPIMIKVRPAGGNNISYLYPSYNLYPGSDLYSKNRRIRFENLTTGEILDYELPDDLLYYDSEHYDEFYLDYDSHTCQVIKKCKYNADGSVSLLVDTQYVNYPYPTIQLNDGDYRLSLLGYNYGYLFMRLMTTNIYTSQFATKAELNTEISQTTEQINLIARRKVDQSEVISTINQSAEQITITGNRFVVNATNFQLTADGTLTCNNANLKGDFSNYNSNGNLAIKISGTQIKFYDYEGTGELAGALASIRQTSEPRTVGVELFTFMGNRIDLGYKDSTQTSIIHNIFSFDTNDLSKTPWIINTTSGTLFQNTSGGGITVENGLIKRWSMPDIANGKIFPNLSQGGITINDGLVTEWDLPGTAGTIFQCDSETGIEVKDGLITGWNMPSTTGELYLLDSNGSTQVTIHVKKGLITGWTVD